MSDDPNLFHSVVSGHGSDSRFIVAAREPHCDGSAAPLKVGALLARGLKSPAWFVDSADFAWPVGAVDPDRMALT